MTSLAGRARRIDQARETASKNQVAYLEESTEAKDRGLI